MNQIEKHDQTNYIALVTANVPSLEDTFASAPRAPPSLLGPVPPSPTPEMALAWRLNAEARLQLHEQSGSNVLESPYADQLETWVLYAGPQTAPDNAYLTGKPNQVTLVHRGPDDSMVGETARSIWPAAYERLGPQGAGLLETSTEVPRHGESLVECLIQDYLQHEQQPHHTMQRLGCAYSHLNALGSRAYTPNPSEANGILERSRRGRGY